MQALTVLVKVCVFIQRSSRAAHHSIQVCLLHEGGRDSQLAALRTGEGLTSESGLAKDHHPRQAILHLRKGQQRDVHQVIAVKVGVQNQVRGVAHMGNHGPHITDEMEVLLQADGRLQVGQMRFQALPLGQERLYTAMPALAFGQPFVRELQLGRTGFAGTSRDRDPPAA